MSYLGSSSGGGGGGVGSDAPCCDRCCARFYPSGFTREAKAMFWIGWPIVRVNQGSGAEPGFGSEGQPPMVAFATRKDSQRLKVAIFRGNVLLGIRGPSCHPWGVVVFRANFLGRGVLGQLLDWKLLKLLRTDVEFGLLTKPPEPFCCDISFSC